jgi:hypothetical protein
MNTTNAPLLSMKIATLLPIALLCFSACIDRSSEIDFERVMPRIVLEGLLIDGRIAEIKVGRSSTVLADTLTHRIPDDRISVSVYKDGVFWQRLILNTEADRDYSEEAAIPMTNATYSSEAPLQLQPGHEYQLVAEAAALATAFSPVLVYAPTAIADSFRIRVQRRNEGQESCSITGYEVSGIDTSSHDSFYFITSFDERYDIQGRLLYSRAQPRFDDDEKANLIYSVDGFSWPCNRDRQSIVEIVGFPQEYFDFIEIKDSYFESLGGVFATPEALPHNIEGGYGYVGLGTSYRIPFPN